MTIAETQSNKNQNPDGSRPISYGMTISLNKGFTLFIAIAVMGTLLLIATSIINLSVKQSQISDAGRESQIAFYAADSGMECALFWDVKNPDSEQSAFNIATTQIISCNQDGANPDNEWEVGGSSESIIDITFLPEEACAVVTVTKNPDGTTEIKSRGYNTCDPSNPRRVERAVRATY